MSEGLTWSHRRLVSLLIQAREGAGLTTRQLAEQLGWGQPKVSRIERGVVRARATDVEAWMRAVGASPEARREAVELALELAVEVKSWASIREEAGGSAAQQSNYAELEAAALELLVFQRSIIPGLAQTAAYIRHIQQLVGRVPEEIEDVVTARLARQQVLYAPAKRITLLVSESASLAAVPLDTPAPTMPPQADYTIWTMPDDDFVTVETPGGEVRVNDPEKIQTYRERAQSWLTVAHVGSEALAVINRVRQTFS
jgi:transcriptional regulator with XRE-family HTH domain